MGPLTLILPAGQSERQSKETEIWETNLPFSCIATFCVGWRWGLSLVGVHLITSTSFPFKAIGKQGLECGVSTGSHTTGAFLGVGFGVHSMTSTSFPFKAIGKQGLECGVSTGSHTTGAFLGVGFGVHSMTSTSFPFEAIGKRGLEHSVSTGSLTTGATRAFLGVCNSAVWMDGVDIGVVDGSGGAVSVSVSFVTKKAIWN